MGDDIKAKPDYQRYKYSIKVFEFTGIIKFKFTPVFDCVYYITLK